MKVVCLGGVWFDGRAVLAFACLKSLSYPLGRGVMSYFRLVIWFGGC